jgi:hypothetical protein
MDRKISWVADLKAPSEECRREYLGVPLIISADDVSRAAVEMRKGLHDVVFNTVLIRPAHGDVHYILGSLA